MDSQVPALPEQGQTLPSCCSTVGTRAGKSKSLIWWKRRKGGKRQKKAEKADLIMQLAFWQKRKSSLFFLLPSVLLAKSPLDDISSHQAISGLSRHGALTVPGSNPPPTPLISSSEALVRNINVSILSWPNAPNRSTEVRRISKWPQEQGLSI